MTSIATGYDWSASTYSPDGRVFQVEYANKAVENSGTAIAIRVKDGVVFAVEKVVTSKLLVPGANRRIQTIDRHVGMATAGFLADGRHLAARARDEATNIREQYGQPTIRAIVERLGMYTQAYTLYSSVRPFGCSALIGGYDKDGPALYCMEPSGVAFGYNAAAAGKGRTQAKNELEKLKFSELTTREAVMEAARIIHVVHEEIKEKDFELEMSWIGPESEYRHVPVPDDLFTEANTRARELLENFD